MTRHAWNVIAPSPSYVMESTSRPYVSFPHGGCAHMQARTRMATVSRSRFPQGRSSHSSATRGVWSRCWPCCCCSSILVYAHSCVIGPLVGGERLPLRQWRAGLLLALALLAAAAPTVAALADRHVASPRNRNRGVDYRKLSGIATICSSIVMLCVPRARGASARSLSLIASTLAVHLVTTWRHRQPRASRYARVLLLS